MEIKGKITHVLPETGGISSKTGNRWVAAGYVIETPGQYPHKIAFEVFGEDKIRQFNIGLGEELTVQFDVDAHEYNGRWFNSVRAFNIIREQKPQPKPQPQPQNNFIQPPLFEEQNAAPEDHSYDPLPF